jgi:hypothetical protein
MDAIADKLKAMSNFLISRSFPSYNENCGRCAKSVREAIEYAFAPKTLIRKVSAKDYGSSLESFGFKNLLISPQDLVKYKPLVGDVSIIHYEPHGHISAYCEGVYPKSGQSIKCWISDFQQLDMYGGKIRKKSPKVSIYRMSFLNNS